MFLDFPPGCITTYSDEHCILTATQTSNNLSFIGYLSTTSTLVTSGPLSFLYLKSKILLG